MNERATSRAERPAHPADVSCILNSENFREVVTAHHRTVLRFITSRIGHDAAEDIVADTFVAAWRSRATFVDPSDNGLEAWLIGIASVLVSAHRRSEFRWLRAQAASIRSSVTPDDSDEANERVDAVARMRQARIAELIVEMPRREREPLLLHVLEGLSYPEIATVLGIPIGTVRSRISRGRSRLHALTEKERT